MTKLKAIRKGYGRYTESYKRYLKRRGFQNHVNDRLFFRRAFLECWAEPGFHWFWQTYNPGIAYFCFKLYRWSGGNSRRYLATMISFISCGLGHNLIVYPFLGWSYTLPVAFTFFGSLTMLNLKLSPLSRQQSWPLLLNSALNVALVLIGMDIGFRVDSWIR